MRALRVVLATLAAAAPSAALADEIPSYRAAFPERANRLLHVSAEIPTGGRDEVALWLPAWTPGSYKIRDYSRQVEGLEARSPGGAPLPVRKEGKSRWLVSCAGLASFELGYRLHCRELSVRTNYVESGFASVNGAATWIVPEGSERSPYDIRFLLPPEWPESETALPPHPSGEPHRYLAPDFDTLADSPILLGDLDVRRFTVRGVPHSLVSHGGEGLWDFERAADDCRRIAEVQADFWGEIPYASFRILNLLVEGSGGLEHGGSTLLMASRFDFREPKRYRDWLSLVSHELFHAWNGKRLRPAALGPFDYTQEVHTEDLWVVEGLTSYYEDLLLARAGLLDRKLYLERLSDSIAALQKTPGREVHALGATSHDAWTHHYQPDEGSKDKTISYYTKGSVVGFLLDASIRAATDGARSLDDAMRLAASRHSGARGYTSAEFRAACAETAGVDLAPFFAHAIDSTRELDYAPALDAMGLRFAPPKERKVDAEPTGAPAEAEGEGGEPPEDPEEEPAPPTGWIGWATSLREGRIIVTEVRRGTIAYAAGFAVGDEVIAVAGYRLGSGGWDERMRQHRPGETVEVLIARRGELVTIPVTLGEEPKESWKLELRDDATAEQKARLTAWLGAAGADLVAPAPSESPTVPATSPPSPPAPPGSPGSG